MSTIFGNLASNIVVEDLRVIPAEKGRIEVHLGPSRIAGLVDTLAKRQPGELVALFGSTGNLIVSVVNGSASSRLGVQVGDVIRVVFPKPETRQGGGSHESRITARRPET